MLNKLYIYLLINILKVNVPLPAFIVNYAPSPPSIDGNFWKDISSSISQNALEILLPLLSTRSICGIAGPGVGVGVGSA